MVGLGLLVIAGLLTVEWAVILFAISDLAASVAMVILLGRCRAVRRLGGSPSRRDTASIVRFALPLWLSGLLRQFRRNIESLMLGAKSADSSVGNFAVAARHNLVGHVTLLSLLVAVKPTLAELHDKGDRAGLAKLYTTSTRWSFGLNLPFFVVVVLFAEPLLRVFGESFAAGTTALIILSFAELANAATGTCGPLLDMTGHTRIKLVNSIIWTGLLIGGGAVMIPRWGVTGAALATVLAVGTVNLVTVIEVWLLERVQPYDRTYWKPIIAGVVAAAFAVMVRAALPPDDRFVVAAVEGALVVAVYGATIALLGLAPEDRMVVDRAIGSIRRSRSEHAVVDTAGRRP
jgi:O-antigen/teichoic acid export membrane protein